MVNNVNPNAQLFPAEITYPANFNGRVNSIGGKIVITPDQLIFKAHDLNFGNLDDRIYEIRNITGYKKGLMTFLYIYFNDGQNIKLTVWKKQEIIGALESRRKALIG